MKIKTFAEFQVEVNQLFDTESSYNAGIQEAKSYYENDRITIHEYYTKKVKELLGEETEVEVFSENNGKIEEFSEMKPVLEKLIEVSEEEPISVAPVKKTGKSRKNKDAEVSV